MYPDNHRDKLMTRNYPTIAAVVEMLQSKWHLTKYELQLEGGSVWSHPSSGVVTKS